MFSFFPETLSLSRCVVDLVDLVVVVVVRRAFIGEERAFILFFSSFLLAFFCLRALKNVRAC
jgi:hypothetical protein